LHRRRDLPEGVDLHLQRENNGLVKSLFKVCKSDILLKSFHPSGIRSLDP
jgi:hypothetical protein